MIHGHLNLHRKFHHVDGRDHRPYLIFELIDVLDDYEQTPQEGHWHITLHYRFANYGSVPAMIVSYGGYPEIEPNFMHFDQVYSSSIGQYITVTQQDRSDIVKEKDGITKDFLLTRNFPDFADFHQAKSERTKQLYFGGTVSYQSVVGGNYTTSFCYVWEYHTPKAVRADGGKSCTNDRT